MKKKEFEKEIRQLVGERLFAADSTLTIECKDVAKNNGVKLTGLIIKSSDVNIAPTIYLDYYYDKFTDGLTSIEECVDSICECYEANRMTKSMDIDFIRNFESIKDMLFPCICASADNEEFLASHPHTDMLDLSIYYRLLLSDNNFEGEATIAVTDELVATWGEITVNDLNKIAWENSKTICPATFASMSEVLSNMMQSDLADMPTDELFASNPMYILSNTSRVNGAVWLASLEKLSEIATQLESDLFILPSSRHECILLPANSNMDADALKEMVIAVNSTEVSPEDKLSDSVYYFNSSTKELSIAA